MSCHKLIEFERDSNKADANLRKHCFSFEDATRVFLDPHRIETFDGRESEVGIATGIRDYGPVWRTAFRGTYILVGPESIFTE